MSVRLARISIATAIALATAATVARPWVLLGSKWPDGTVTINLQLGNTTGTLSDGLGTWNASAADAYNTWNNNISKVRFNTVQGSTAATGDGNRINNVFFSSTVYGDAMDANTLAVTTEWSSGTTKTEADTVFNTRWTWDSYRGAQRTSGGKDVIDFHRVALHEFGHTLGLDHPDEYGQRVSAQMNSTISNLDSLTSDDIAGAQAMYGSASSSGGTTTGGTTTGGGTTTTPTTPTVTVSFPPRNEALDFRSQLETKYRTGLKRAASLLTYVDNEGDVVWTTEYLRYRVYQCAHTTAVTKVMTEIGGGAQPATCGNPTSGTVTFPARTDALDFRSQLETRYRDVLRRGTNATAVDNEGDVVWTQEYLRYRVNGCAHADAVSKVFLQIDGKGVQAVCR